MNTTESLSKVSMERGGEGEKRERERELPLFVVNLSWN